MCLPYSLLESFEKENYNMLLSYKGSGTFETFHSSLAIYWISCSLYLHKDYIHIEIQMVQMRTKAKTRPNTWYSTVASADIQPFLGFCSLFLFQK